MVGDVLRPHLCDVAVRLDAEIGKIGLLAVLVPLIGIDTLPAGRLKGEAHPPDAGEQVDEPVPAALGRELRFHLGQELPDSRVDADLDGLAA